MTGVRDDGEPVAGSRVGSQLVVELYVRPALVAVALEVVFVVLFGNQWMYDHLAEPWVTSGSAVKQGFGAAFAAFAWPVSAGGYGWLVAAGIVHALVWFAVSYWLLALTAEVAPRGPRMVAGIGAVVVAAVVALLADRLVSFPDAHRLYSAAATPGIPGPGAPGFASWMLFGSVAGGAILAAVLIAVLGVLAMEPFAAGALESDLAA